MGPGASQIRGPVDGTLAPLAPLPNALAEVFTHLTERQFEFLAWRLGSGTDEEAADACDTGILEVMTWRADPEFEQIYQRALDNKRDGFRVLGTHLLPKALRVINKMLESTNLRANTTGLQLLLKTQALLDAPTVDKSEQAVRLIEMLRTPGTPLVNTMGPRD